MGRILSLANISLIVFFLLSPVNPMESRAEAISLGPFNPKLILYEVSIVPTATVAADIATNHDGAYVKGDLYFLIENDELTKALSKIAKKLLPTNLQKKTCILEFQRAESLEFRILSNTGAFKSTVAVVTHGAFCPLSSGDVALALRFVPSVAKKNLSLQLVKLNVTAPASWTLFGATEELEDMVRKWVADFSLPMPAIAHVAADFQGASFDVKGDSFVIRVRADAQVGQQAVMDAVNRLDEIRNFSFSYPK